MEQRWNIGMRDGARSASASMMSYGNWLLRYAVEKAAPRGWNRRGHGTGGEAPMQDIGYVRVSTEEQHKSGAGLAAQRAAIEAECQRRGWELVEVIEDEGYSAKDMKRPGVQVALETLQSGEAGALVALDCAVDTTTPAGEAMAHVLATFAQFERRLIGQRTREAMAEKRKQGVGFGRPLSLPVDLRARIAAEREAGRSLAAIADTLNEEQVPTAQGGRRWWPSTVRAVLRAA
jgi:DNA invertase Pin-like site-specific DNA recombinase